MIAVSVIIPVYNAEKYLQECLDSVANQSLYEIEIITVNDGSTDHSSLILQRFADKEKRCVIIDSIKRGAGAA